MSDKWDEMIAGFNDFEQSKQVMDFDRFKSKYAILFNKQVENVDSDSAEVLMKEYLNEIDRYSPVKLVRNLNNDQEEELVITLPPMQTRVPTLNECAGDDIPTALSTQLEVHNKNKLNTTVGKVVSHVVDSITDKSITEVLANKNYINIVDDLINKSTDTNGEEIKATESTEDQLIWE